MANMKFIKVTHKEVKEGDVLIWNSPNLGTDYFLVGYTDEGFVMTSLVDGNRFTETKKTLDELITVLEKDGNFEYFGKININNVLVDIDRLNDIC